MYKYNISFLFLLLVLHTSQVYQNEDGTQAMFPV